ncbi:hypothetical protein MtrunA17_Chr7g0230221 [Medicago truncatula]|uniref:Uncharacterized protein n=1 Tax=Medicago truncatula TaxID=3880 RepID=A0A396GWG8_MEDTR|nr:hypothetical protein MtrunA17_Chr7g0230221 [Medicago truncatula]
MLNIYLASACGRMLNKQISAINKELDQTDNIDRRTLTDSKESQFARGERGLVAGVGVERKRGEKEGLRENPSRELPFFFFLFIFF